MEHSAGAVLYRMDNGKPLYLLLRYFAGHWDFPKGGIDGDETPHEACAREIEEETGIGAFSFIPGFREEVSYEVVRGGKAMPKKVEYFLAETREESVRVSSEHTGFAWLGFEAAMVRITFDNARGVLARAHEQVLKRVADKIPE